MKINEAGLNIIKAFEALRLKAYRDAVGVWTIGWGHTKGVRPGMVITEAEAGRLLRIDVEDAEEAVTRATKGYPTTENQFSALVSFTFNVGAGGLQKSSVLKQHRAGHYALAGAAFMLWVKGTINGRKQTLRGLVRRRQAERRLYATGT